MSEAASKPAVLVVDDQLSMRIFCRTTLELAGFRVEEASNGQEGLAAMEREAFACVVLDVEMPVLDGWGVLAALGYPRPAADAPPIYLHSGAGNSAEFQAKARSLRIPLHFKGDPTQLVPGVQARIAGRAIAS
jgi:two-component system chemotaxis response regulator CheY